MIMRIKYGFHGMTKTLILVISTLSFVLFSGCNKTIFANNYMNDLKKRITNEFTSSSKRQIKNRDKKIAELNTAISEKNEEAIYDQMSEYVKKDEDKLRAQLKKIVNYIPRTVTESTDCSWGTIVHNVESDKFYDGRANIFIYRLTYTAINDQKQKYYVTIEYMKENEIRPTQAGIDYISIFGENNDDMVDAGEILY